MMIHCSPIERGDPATWVTQRSLDSVVAVIVSGGVSRVMGRRIGTIDGRSNVREAIR